MLYRYIGKYYLKCLILEALDIEAGEYVVKDTTNKDHINAIGHPLYDVKPTDVEPLYTTAVEQLHYELLRNAPTKALFATVSGDCDNSASPENLYRKCGFIGDDVWHIIKS